MGFFGLLSWKMSVGGYDQAGREAAGIGWDKIIGWDKMGRAGMGREKEKGRENPALLDYIDRPFFRLAAASE